MTIDKEKLASVAGNVLSFALVFGMSSSVKIEHLKKQLQNRTAILVGVACQFFLLPLLGFVAVKLFGSSFNNSVGITLLVVTSSPGGAYSNWWCSLFNADLALSITMTAISTFLSIIMLPVNLLIYTSVSYEKDVVDNLDWGALMLSLCIVISAILLGIFSSHKLNSKSFRRWANIFGNLAGIGLVIFSGTIANNGEASDSKIWSRSWQFYVGVAAPCVLGLMLTTIIATCAKLKQPERVTVAIECSYQNVGIATSLALSIFSAEDLTAAMGVPLFYAVTEIVLISLFCLGAWKMGWTKAPTDANICQVFFTSYEEAEARIASKSKSDSITLDRSDMDTETEIAHLDITAEDTSCLRSNICCDEYA